MISLLITAAVALQTPINTLSDAEQKAGWKLLFDGKSTTGWHNFKSKGVADGWVVKDGVLEIVNPETAGDIMTDEQFDWFELSLDFKMGPGQNSGIMYRVTELGEATWHTGPEIQIYDHEVQEGVETTGYLYQLYKPDAGVKPVKAAGEWNHFRIGVGKEKCWTELNGVKLYEYVFGSEDFWERVKKSKFKDKPHFAKADKGSIAIQGDHGLVSFRNIKIRPLK